MTRQNALKYILPVCGVLILALLAAWAFRLPPVSALTERGSTPVAGPSQPVGQISGYGYDTISVSGTGTATGELDLAMLSLGVSVTKSTVAEAREQAAGSMTAVREALVANGVAENDIQTTHFSVHSEYDWSTGERKFKGYKVSNGLTVTVRDIEAVGTVIDAAIVAGGNDIEFNSLRFSVSDTTALEKKAREDAVNDMRGKARQLALFSGRPLGKLKVISETPIADAFETTREFAGALAADAGTSTPISPGMHVETVTVYGVYELR